MFLGREIENRMSLYYCYHYNEQLAIRGVVLNQNQSLILETSTSLLSLNLLWSFTFLRRRSIC